MRHRNRGYTLLELVVALLLLLLICTSTATLLSSARRLGNAASRHVRAHQMAEAVLEELASLPPGGPSPSLAAFAGGSRGWTPTVAVPEPFRIPPDGIAVRIASTGDGSALAPAMYVASVTIEWTETHGSSTLTRRASLQRLLAGNLLR